MTARLVKQTLVSASLIIIAANLVSRLLGFGREAVIAGLFGTSPIFELFVVAFTVPELLSFVIYSSAPTALVPIVQGQDDTRRGQLFWAGMFSFLVALGMLAMAIFFTRDFVLTWLAPTLSAEYTALGRDLAALMAWFVILRGMEAYFRGWLVTVKQFVVPATTPLLINFCVIAVVYFGFPQLGIRALAYGWLLGSAIVMLYNFIAALAIIKPGWRAAASWRPVGVLLGATVVVGLIEAIALIYPVVDRYFASRLLGDGQIAALRYAVFLIHIPTGIFVVSFNFAAFPWITDLTTTEARERLQSMYRKSLRMILLVMTPVAVIAAMFPREIVLIAFRRGAFDTESLALTATPVFFYALGIVFYSLYLFQMRFYYARRLYPRLGLWLLLMLVVKTVLSAGLVGPISHDGLAAATAITWLLGFVIMSLDLKRYIDADALGTFLRLLPRLAGTVVIMAGALWGLSRLWPIQIDASTLSHLARLGVLTVVGFAIYLGAGILLGVTDVQALRDYGRRILRRDRAH